MSAAGARKQSGLVHDVVVGHVEAALVLAPHKVAERTVKVGVLALGATPQGKACVGVVLEVVVSVS